MAKNLAYLCFCCLLIPLVCDSQDTIHPNTPLHDGSSISSPNGSFQMGFFSPDGSQQRFFGIWYNNKTISPRTVVWVANRDSHLDATSGALHLSLDGNLQLLNATNGTAVWSSNSTGAVGNPVAQLLESGNLVVKDGSKKYLWQSFDDPTDTALPGMKMGKNLATGVDRILRSWRTDSDPSTGDYSFLLDSHGFPQLLLMASSSAVRFRLGPWNGESFSGVAMMAHNPTYTFDFVFNQEEIYYTFNLINSSAYSRLFLSSSGILQRYTWNYETQKWATYTPVDSCLSYGRCSGNGICNGGTNPVCSCLDKFTPNNSNDWAVGEWSAGCDRKTPLNCLSDGFIKYPGVKLPDTRGSWYNKSMNLEECKEMCSKNCSCTAYSNIDIRERSGCLLWFGDLMDTTNRTVGGQDIYIRMASSELASIRNASTGSTGQKMKILTVGLALLAVILVSGLIWALYTWKKRQRKQEMQASEVPSLEGTAGRSARHTQQTRDKKEDLQLPLFDLSTVLKATDYFSEENKIGEGGFGPVYKGILQGQDIAVKRRSKNSNQGLEEFKNEVILIAKLQHRNLVRLLGCCIEAEEKMLIYEYMPNNSLDTFIFNENKRKSLDWPSRFHIINGIARGLLYLHQDSRLRIIHRDLKAGNILLDDGMNPKISDFGMARSFGGNESEANTRRVVGTYGYMSPEYAVDGDFSVKSDVFSFGVLVLEIISGAKNRGFSQPDHHHNLIGHAWILHNEERVLELVDECLSINSTQLPEISRSIHVGLLCAQKLPEDRPSMSNVVLMLGSEGELPKPKEPGFFTERNLFHQSDAWSSKPTESSSNEMSISSIMEPR